MTSNSYYNLIVKTEKCEGRNSLHLKLRKVFLLKCHTAVVISLNGSAENCFTVTFNHVKVNSKKIYISEILQINSANKTVLSHSHNGLKLSASLVGLPMIKCVSIYTHTDIHTHEGMLKSVKKF